MANIEQNNILCDSKKILLTPQNEKVLLVFHNLFWKKTFEHEVKGKTHLLSELWALLWLTPVRTSPGLPYTHL